MAASPTFATHDAFAEFLEQNLNKELLRFTTAGSVDDGKSTLIGRLLHDSKGVYEDQLASVKKSRVNRSGGEIDFSLFTDGLKAEREQGITIDVGYRYFATSKRKFIIADTPGHEQYTRNMATGASTADLAVILIDGTKGLLPQTFRHAYIASLLGIRNVLAAVNKMDLVDYREADFLAIQKSFLALAHQLSIPHVQCIPVSALAGDNVISHSAKTSWYSGPTFLEHLESVPLSSPFVEGPLRLPVQYVLRPDATFRGFAGQIASGTLHPGEEILALPSGRRTLVEKIVSFDGDLPEAFSPMSVSVQLRDEIDLSRGDMLVAPGKPPAASNRFSAMLVWMHADSLDTGRSYLLKHTSRQVRARILKIHHRVNVNTLAHEPASRLQMNDIVSVDVQSSLPLFFDPYTANRITGSFVLIDPLTNATVAAGMIQRDLASRSSWLPDSLGEIHAPVDIKERTSRHGHTPLLIFNSGAPSLGEQLERALYAQGFHAFHWNSRAIPENVRVTTLNTLFAAGLIVIDSGNPLPTESLAELSAATGGSISELDALIPGAAGKISPELLSLALEKIRALTQEEGD